MSRRARLHLLEDRLDCGDWTIRYDEIREAVLSSFRSHILRIPGFGLAVRTENKTYHFGLNGSRYWDGELPFPVTRQKSKLRMSPLSFMARADSYDRLPHNRTHHCSSALRHCHDVARQEMGAHYDHLGFTVYGAIPVPVLDITINRHGILWFRQKTHQITREELDALVKPGVEIVVVGIGWDSIAQLTDDAKLISTTIDLRVLPTPAAFALYNKLKAEGRKVVEINIYYNERNPQGGRGSI